jgi:HlyD family secretion protein
MIQKLLVIAILIASCGKKVESTKPIVAPITESVYASGVVKSKNQYQAFATVNGIIEHVFVSEGDTVKKGDIILTISNETQKLNKENARLNADFNDINANKTKLNDAKLQIDLAYSKFKNDSMLYFNQKDLWQKDIGTKVELDQRELAFKNAKVTYLASLIRFEDLSRQLQFASSQSKKNLEISNKLASDYTLRSEIDGRVYSLNKLKGELVTSQTPLCVIGDKSEFILEMQIDENDILKLRSGQVIYVTLDSYRGKVFEAKLTKIYPLMNERNKTFDVEAEFIKQPEILYPNITLEANIVIHTKNDALLIPRDYITDDNKVTSIQGETKTVTTGLKDFKFVEILSGIDQTTELIKPTK